MVLRHRESIYCNIKVYNCDILIERHPGMNCAFLKTKYLKIHIQQAIVYMYHYLHFNLNVKCRQ